MQNSGQGESVRPRGPVRITLGVIAITATLFVGVFGAVGSYQLRADPKYTSPGTIIALTVFVLIGAALSWWIMHLPGSPIPAIVSLVGGTFLLLISVVGVGLGGFLVYVSFADPVPNGTTSAIGLIVYSIAGVAAGARLMSSPFRRRRKAEAGTTITAVGPHGDQDLAEPGKYQPNPANDGY